MSEWEISRREFLKDAGMIAGSAAIGSVTTLAATPASAQAAPVSLTLHDPSGAVEVTQTFAARLGDLNGKTIGEVSDGIWEAPRTFELINQLLQKQFPTIKIITADKFPVTSNAVDVPGLEDAIKAAKVDAVIVGNAG